MFQWLRKLKFREGNKVVEQELSPMGAGYLLGNMETKFNTIHEYLIEMRNQIKNLQDRLENHVSLTSTKLDEVSLTSTNIRLTLDELRRTSTKLDEVSRTPVLTEKLIRILNLFKEKRQLSVKEVAEAFQTSTVTASTQMTELSKIGYIIPTTKRGTYIVREGLEKKEGDIIYSIPDW